MDILYIYLVNLLKIICITGIWNESNHKKCRIQSKLLFDMKYNKGWIGKKRMILSCLKDISSKSTFWLWRWSFICTSITADCSFLNFFGSTDSCLIQVIMHFFSFKSCRRLDRSITITSYYNIIGFKFLPNVTIISF